MKLNKPGTTTTTHNGGKGFKRTQKMALFLRATTSFAGESKFYEKGAQNDTVAIQLARELAVADWEWFTEFLPWLRQSANIRTMSVMLAAEGVHARLAAKKHGLSDGKFSNRQLIESVLQRPDEPGELIAYWLNTYGRAIPKPVKRGAADALRRMLNQRQALRYNKDAEVRLGDVIELVHPRPRVQRHADPDGNPVLVPDAVQAALYGHLITDRHNRDNYLPPAVLGAVDARNTLNALTPDERHGFARKVKAGDVTATAVWKEALAGQWEWGRSWLGAK